LTIDNGIFNIKGIEYWIPAEVYPALDEGQE
jgi:hypothetical protein